MELKHAILLFLLLSVMPIFGQDKQKELEKYFSALAENEQFNGSVLVADHGKIVFERSAGYSDFGGKVLNSNKTLFPLASVSKTITATAIIQLAQSGKLEINDPVTKYFPEFPYPAITLKHLLSHTSGLPPYNAYFDSLKAQQPSKVFTNADFMAGVVTNKKPLKYQPGDNGNYDNINYIVLALILEKVSGMPFQEYIQEKVLKPSGMISTKLLPLNFQNTQPSYTQYAYPYLFPHQYSDSLVKAMEVPFILNYWTAYNFSGFSGYASTTRDLLKYDEAYYNGSLFKENAEQVMYSPVKLNNGKNNAANFGLGWQIDRDTTYGKIVYHGGNATGLSCILLRNISKHQTIIVFDNIHNDNSRGIAFNVLKVLNGVQVSPPKKSIAKIYARVLLKSGAGVARDTVSALMKDMLHYDLSEDEMNTLGYDFLGGINNPNPYHFPEEHKYTEAVETFKLNMELFPASWNVYDSYGEALVIVGKKEEAIKMYRKSIELNPHNEGGKKILEQLLK